MEEEKVLNQDERMPENGTTAEVVKEEPVVVLPMVAIRGRVVFPSTFINFDVGRERSIKAVEDTKNFGGLLFVSAQKKASVEKPTPQDIASTGVVVKIRQIIKSNNTSMYGDGSPHCRPMLLLA